MKPAYASLLALLIGAGLALASCADRPTEAWPEGTLLLARGEALSSLLAQLEGLEATPLGRLARDARARLPECPQISARAIEGGIPALADELRCADGELGALERARGERDIALAIPLGERMHAIVSLSVHPSGDVDAEISIPADAITGLGRLVAPGSEPPGAPVLSGHASLTHVRIRPDAGIDIASLIPDDSQGADLFRLQSEIFSGVVLDGTWEAALYLPEPGRSMPRAALALGFRARGAAVAAMERFVSDLEAIWPVRRSPFRVRAAQGACLLELRLLPDLSPCYVATDRALLLGWNPASLRRALDGEPGAVLTESGGVAIDLDLFREADARLADTLGDAGAPEPSTWPWKRVEAQGVTQDEAVQLRVQLHVASDA